MADLRGFDANQVDPASDFDPIPAGKYVAAIIASEMKPNKAGTGHSKRDILGFVAKRWSPAHLFGQAAI